MLVGDEKDSWMLIVGKSMGRPPDDKTPRLTEEIRLATLKWQGLKDEYVLIMPML